MANNEQAIQVGNFQWVYREEQPATPSENPPVILLHGLPSQSYSWREVLPTLAAQGFRVLAPDWLGFGYSDKPDRRDFAYTPDAFVSALQDWLQALEISYCSIVVQGFLGSVGLQYAVRYPNQVDRLAIFNAPISPAAQLPWKMKQLGLPMIGDVMTQDPLLVDRTLEGGGGYRVEDADLDVYRRPFLKSSDAGRALLATLQNLQLPAATAEIATGLLQWEKPILLAWGDRDPWLKLSLAEELLPQLKQAELIRLEEVGHYPQEDWHEKVSAALIPFLRRSAVG